MVKIYSSTVTGVTRSEDGKPGEKTAKYNTNEVFGNVKENTTSGIFGTIQILFLIKKCIQLGKEENINRRSFYIYRNKCNTK